MRRLGLTPEQRALILSLFRTPTKLVQPPRKTCRRSIARSILATDPSLLTELVQEIVGGSVDPHVRTANTQVRVIEMPVGLA
jgi:hypothetical protein